MIDETEEEFEFRYGTLQEFLNYKWGPFTEEERQLGEEEWREEMYRMEVRSTR